MNPRPLRGQARVVGESQGFIGLPIRDIVEPVELTGPPPMFLTESFFAKGYQSLWTPSPEELALLNAGVPIRLTVLTTGLHPPVRLEVDACEL